MGVEDDAAAFFRPAVLGWWRDHRRTFPWRETREPYAVLMAEIMLRRTRADQAARVFERFLARFPDPATLDAADPDEVAAIVRPLGLDWRTPAFKRIARALVGEHGGEVPDGYLELRTLPGVGDYVAAAVRIFAFGRPETLADTNTVRVAARYFGFPYHADSRRIRAVRQQVDRLLDPTRPRESAGALLDFAALVCRAGTPLCARCPVATACAYARARAELTGGNTG